LVVGFTVSRLNTLRKGAKNAEREKFDVQARIYKEFTGGHNYIGLYVSD
jgi:hypothetical protein